MEKPPKNIYEGSEAESEEKKRLEALDYPNFVSEELIGENLEGKTVLDLGAGPNPELGRFVEQHGGEYVAFDISEVFLKEQKKEGATGVRGDVRLLPFKDKSVDTAHMRFVLMHLSPEDRKHAIQEVARVAQQRRLFLEYDWGAARGNESVEKFIELNEALAPRKGVNIFMGQTLRDELETIIGNERLEEKRFQRGYGNYSKEWAMLGKTVEKVLSGVADEQQASELKDVVQKLQDEAQKENPDPSVRPDIVAIEIKT